MVLSTSNACFAETESLDVKKAQLPPDFQPSNYCVLCGRGKDCWNSIGNRRFRVIVSIFLLRYAQAESKSMKSQIVSDVVDMVRGAGGHFLKFEDGSWWEVGDSAAREKVGSQFRDCLHSRYSSSGKSKAARRREKQLKAQQGQCSPTAVPVRSSSI